MKYKNMIMRFRSSPIGITIYPSNGTQAHIIKRAHKVSRKADRFGNFVYQITETVSGV